MGRVARPGLAAAGVGVAVAALVVARLALAGDAFDRVWAEDGRIFLGDVHRHGLESLVYLYGDYLHTVPRLIALAFEPFSLDAYSAYAVLTAAAVTGALAAFVFRAALELSGSLAGALIASLIMALAPALGIESLGTLANLHWFFVYAAFWALLLSPDSRLRRVAAVVALLAVLSSAIALALIPVALVVHRNPLRSWPVRALFAGAVLLAIALLAAPESPQGIERVGGIHPKEFVEGLLGVVGAETGDATAGIALRVALGAALAACLAWTWLTAGPQRRWATLAWVSGAAIFAFVIGETGSAAPRYEGLLAMFVAAGLAFLVGSASRAAVGAALAALLAVIAIEFPADDLRVSGPSWESEVEAAQAKCAGGAEEVSVPVSPAGWGTAELRCDKI